ncbi:hypothetical protein [Tessaracoccus sp.]
MSDTKTAISFTNGDIFAYLNTNSRIVVWVRIGGSWLPSDADVRAPGGDARASDDDVREAMSAELVEEHLGEGHVRRTLRANRAGDLYTWTLVSASAADDHEKVS